MGVIWDASGSPATPSGFQGIAFPGSGMGGAKGSVLWRSCVVGPCVAVPCVAGLWAGCVGENGFGNGRNGGAGFEDPPAAGLEGHVGLGGHVGLVKDPEAGVADGRWTWVPEAAGKEPVCGGTAGLVQSADWLLGVDAP